MEGEIFADFVRASSFFRDEFLKIRFSLSGHVNDVPFRYQGWHALDCMTGPDRIPALVKALVFEFFLFLNQGRKAEIQNLICWEGLRMSQWKGVPPKWFHGVMIESSVVSWRAACMGYVPLSCQFWWERFWKDGTQFSGTWGSKIKSSTYMVVSRVKDVIWDSDLLISFGGGGGSRQSSVA